MSSVTITLPEDHLAKLKEVAAGYDISLEEFLRASVEDLLSMPDEQFQKAADHVLRKNVTL